MKAKSDTGRRTLVDAVGTGILVSAGLVALNGQIAQLAGSALPLLQSSSA